MIITDELKLKQECQNVSLLEVSGIIYTLENELKKSKVSGIGLAANQIGLNTKVCIIRIPNKKPLNLANPIIIKKYDIMEFENEGCLSYPNQLILTKRFNEVMIQDLLHPAGVILTGLEAVVAQHEVGHLYGEVMFDYQIIRPQLNQKCWCDSNKKYRKCHKNRIIKATIYAEYN